MNAWWAIQAARINDLSLRERLFLFVSLLAVMLALVDVLWLTPAQNAFKQAQQRFASQNMELDRLRAELLALSKPVDATADVRAALAQSQARMEALGAEIAAIAPEASLPSEAIEQVLVQFLKRSPGLRLVSSGTVAAEDGAPELPSPPGVQRRGLELRVTGSYAELSRYVQNLERALPRLRWGSMQLAVDKQVPELTLRVYVLEVQP